MQFREAQIVLSLADTRQAVVNGSDATRAPRLRYRNLLEEADRRASEGEVEEAIDRVREALDLATNSRVISALEHYLRLPLLLQCTGRLEEAREEFRRLLEEGYSGQLDNQSVQWTERGLIHDAMRRAFVREGNPAEAALQEGLAYLAEGYGRFLNSGQEEPDVQVGFLSGATARAVAENMASRLENASTGKADAELIADLLVQTIRRFGTSGAEELLEEAERRLRQQLLSAED